MHLLTLFQDISSYIVAASWRSYHTYTVGLDISVASISSYNPRLTTWCCERGSVGAKPLVERLLVFPGLYDTGYRFVGWCYATEWIWDWSDALLMVLHHEKESKHLHSIVYKLAVFCKNILKAHCEKAIFLIMNSWWTLQMYISSVVNTDFCMTRIVFWQLSDYIRIIGMAIASF